MQKTVLVFVTLGFLVQACHEQSNDKQPAAVEEKKDYFPVADYIRSEINYVDSLPLGIVKYHIAQDKKDSSYIKTEEFDKLAKEFLPAELSDSSFTRDFTESSFIDQTTQSVTFTYSTADAGHILRRVDVLASPEQGFNKVKSIYMEKTINKGDSIVIKKMYWKAKRSFQIISILEAGNQPAVTSQLKVVWDNRD